MSFLPSFIAERNLMKSILNKALGSLIAFSMIMAMLVPAGAINVYADQLIAIDVIAVAVLEGADIQEGQFTFTLEAVTEGAPMPERSETVNGADGIVSFGEVSFVEDGDYQYRVTELAGEDPSILYCDESIDFTINVTTYYKEDGVTKDKIVAQYDEAYFINSYIEEDPIEDPTGDEDPDDGEDPTDDEDPTDGEDPADDEETADDENTTDDEDPAGDEETAGDENTTEDEEPAGDNDEKDGESEDIDEERVPMLKASLSACGKTGNDEEGLVITDEDFFYSLDLVETLSYSGLVEGATYSFTGTVLEVTDEGTLEPVVEIDRELVAEESDGTWEVSFDEINLKNDSVYVVFDRAFSPEDEMAPDEENAIKNEDTTDKSRTIRTVVIERVLGDSENPDSEEPTSEEPKNENTTKNTGGKATVKANTQKTPAASAVKKVTTKTTTTTSKTTTKKSSASGNTSSTKKSSGTGVPTGDNAALWIVLAGAAFALIFAAKKTNIA